MHPTQPPGATPPPPPGAAPAGGQSNGLGIASLILGIVSVPLLCCFSVGVLPALIAIVLGFLGKAKADRGEATNRGMSVAGIILGFVTIVLAVVSTVLFIVGVVNIDFWYDFDDLTNM